VWFHGDQGMFCGRFVDVLRNDATSVVRPMKNSWCCVRSLCNEAVCVGAIVGFCFRRNLIESEEKEGRGVVSKT